MKRVYLSCLRNKIPWMLRARVRKLARNAGMSPDEYVKKALNRMGEKLMKTAR